MHLIENYALSTGLKISKMNLFDAFFPIQFNKYIVIVGSSGMGGKNYSYYQDVLDFLFPYLEQEGVKIVQCGGKDDENLKRVSQRTNGQTNAHQFNYIIKNALLVLSNDTSAIHIAGHYNVPIVGLYGMTHPKVSGSYFGDKDKQIYLEPDREKHAPSFNPNENPKSVDKIPIEKVAKSVLDLLNVKNDFNVETLSIGANYKSQIFELIPDHIITAQSLPGALLHIRYNYVDKNLEFEKNIYNQLTLRKCSIVTDKPLDIEILKKLKGNIQQFIYEITESHDVNFAKKLHLSGIPYLLITFLDNETLNKIKLQYIDFNLMVHQDKASFEQDIENKEKVAEGKTWIKTNKYLLSQGKVYLSKSNWKAGIATNDFANNSFEYKKEIENWEDGLFYLVYNK